MAVLAATKTAAIPTVVVLVHGGGMGIEAVKQQADAILDGAFHHHHAANGFVG